MPLQSCALGRNAAEKMKEAAANKIYEIVIFFF